MCTCISVYYCMSYFFFREAYLQVYATPRARRLSAAPVSRSYALTPTQNSMQLNLLSGPHFPVTSNLMNLMI